MPRRGFIAVVFLLAFAAPLSAQVTFGAQTTNTATLTSVASTTTFGHTTAVTTNRILLVGVHMNIRNATGTTVSGVTYGAQALTLLDAVTDGVADTRTEVWYLLNPPTGLNTVSVTAGGITPGNNVETFVSATTFSGVDQAAPDTATATGSGTPASVTVTGTTTTDAVLDYLTVRETGTSTVGAGQIQAYNNSTGGSGDDVQASMSGRGGVAGNTTMTWGLTAPARRWTQIGVELDEATADVEVTQSALNDPVVPGGILTYTFFIANNGPSSATGVTLTDTIPAATTFISSNTTLGSCSGTTTVTCNLGTMTLGQAATVTIQVQAPLAGGLIAANTGTVTTTSTDPATPNTASAQAYSLVQATVCGTQPGKDGAGGTLAGVINSYWPGTANAAVGATTITVGARRGAAVSITAGDLILVMQMQDAAINSNNDDRYGNGNGIVGGTTGIGAGYTNANNSGRYEYAIATNTIGAAGGNLTFTAVGGGNGLMYAYTNAAAIATQGQRRFQVVRVPQYTTATLGATVTAAAWNGTTGGILAFDVAGDLALGGVTANVNGLGFRGGAGLQRAGGGGGATDVDYRAAFASNAHGVKGEGIAGTPEWVLDSGANLDVGPQGYPNGDFARGAPGNAGGGGTDTDVALNQENSGGGGGANWGRGGGGGNSWQSNAPTGGFGGAPFYNSPGRVVLGGGGGAGARNNSSGIAAAGGAGGGIVLVRAGRITGTGTITANGAAAFNTTANDGGGGGGAGGSVVILSRGGGLGGLTVQANGGRGGNAWSTEPAGGFPGARHGPGGGGGGGYIALNGNAAATSVTGGAPGITTTANDTFGAQTGAPGNVLLTASFDEITGVKSGCVDISVSNSDSPDPVDAGNNITYTQAVTNNSTTVPAQQVTLTQTTPPGTTFVSMTPPAGWTCGTLPAVGGTGTITCTANNPLAAGASSGNFVLVVATSPSLADGSTITQPVTTATSSPEPNTANNTASATTTVRRRVDIAATKVTNSPGADGAFAQGETLIYTIGVTNNGPSRATNVVMTDPLPAGFAFVSVVPGGPTCTQASGTVTCTYAVMDPGAVNNITITGTITVAQTQLINTASTTRTEIDTNATNNNATAIANVLAPTVVHMFEMSAVQDDKGKVLVSWTTSFEAENLGFNVYRETSAGREKVNKQLIAGSALFAAKRELTSGRSYRWKDRLKNGAFAQYYVEDIDLHGVRTLHGPVTPLLAAAVPETANTDTLAELGSTGGIFVSPRGLGAPQYPVIKPTRKQREQQWDLASQSAIKLMVTQEGWYRVTLAELAAAGFTPGHKLALFTEGVEQPILVTNDAVEFYGAGYDTPSSGARAYWLTNEKGTGIRIRNDKTKGSKQSIARTPFTYERIERTVFFTALTNNGDRENFFGAIVTNWSATQELFVENADRTASDATLQLVLQGGSDGEHRVQMTLGQTDLGIATFNGLARHVANVAIPLGALADGANTLTLAALNGDLDVSVVESLRLTYPHRLLADDNALKVTLASGQSATVGGFTSARVRAIDVTDPADPVELNVDYDKDYANGNATVAATGKNGGTRAILMIGDSRILAPAQLVPSRPSTWSSTKNTADLVIVTARAFASAAEPLKQRRDREGVSTTIVDVQDLYDEFNFGQRGPNAIRSFLERTRDWKRAPKYVLFLGDASIDPRNYLGLGAFDYVPTKLVPTFYMKTASDEWFVDGLQLAAGRLPARTLAEAETMIRRIVERDTAGNDAVSFITDSDPEFDFAAAAQELGTLVPPALTQMYAQSATSATFNSLLLTYIGHGSVDFWNAGGFTGGGAAQLTNSKLPIVAGMTCLNGYFHDVYMSSLAEALLTNPNGGAVAVWTSSTLTEPVPQLEMARAFYTHLFSGATIGEAATRAKTATTDADVRNSWILFGDPSMKLR
ncbi:MAG TPA: C25 family cysteine peptidase [Thermoanaerobaculia bacterium]|nr:C25 family cysteine peptidase [Thermoanaerobaculia bacterium]